MDSEERIKYGKIASLAGIACNIVLATAKLIVGIMSGMISVVADAVNNYSDGIAGVVTFVGFRLSLTPADDEHPFGHARYEYISGLVVAFLVMIAGVELLKSSIDKIIHPEELVFMIGLYIVLILSILAKLAMGLMYLRLGKKINSATLIAAFQDSRNDMIATATVLISSVISYYSGYNLDGIMGLLVALFILYSGVGLVKDTIKPLLGTTPDEALVDELENRILQYDGVLGTHDLMVHDYGPGHCFASVHVEVPAERNVLECHELIDRIEEEVSESMKLHLVIHYDPIVTTDEAVHTIREYLANEAKQIYEHLNIHDLRIVPGENNTNVIFDCVIPKSCPIAETEVVSLLKKKLEEKYPNHTAVVKIDHSFVSLKK